MKKIIRLILSITLTVMLVSGNLSVPVIAAGEVSVSITANIEGAEIYINGEFSGKNTPAQISAAAGDVITLNLPGYSAEAQTVKASVNNYDFALAPELYPEEYSDASKHTVFYVGDGCAYSSLTAALSDITAIDGDIWCVIELHEGADTENVPDEYFRLRDHYTIYGGENSTAMRSGINPWGVDGVRLINLDFTSRAWGTQFTIRSYAETKGKAVYTKNIYICGCTFVNASELGIYQCVEFNDGGTAYGSDGTYNVSNINFSNNNITAPEGKDWGIFNFASAGDGDYNVIDGYTVMANRFTNAGIGFLTADAHSWYVYAGNYAASGDMENGEIGVCEYNVIRNILVSGNTIQNGTIGLQSANLGNQNNTLEKAVIRNNHVYSTYNKVDSPYCFSAGLSVLNVTVADNYENDRYHCEPDFTHTDNNVLKDVEIYGNYIETGKGREARIVNVNAAEGEQCGKNNSMSNVTVRDNEFVSANGVFITNYGTNETTAEASLCENNTMTDITFENNKITNPVASDMPGLTISGARLSKHGEQYDGYPDYSGTMERIYVKNNVINDYIYGISLTGCSGDYLNGNSVSEVVIENNTVTNKNQFEYAVTDVGIIIAGASGQTASWEYSPNYVNKNGSLTDITVKGNTITARCGIIVAGLVTTKNLDKPSVNNTVSDVSLTENIINQRQQQKEFAKMGDPGNTGAGITVADVVSFYDYLVETDYNIYELTDGCRVSNVTLTDNVIADDFEVKTVNAAAGIDDTWQALTYNSVPYATKSIGACRIIQIKGVKLSHKYTVFVRTKSKATCTNNRVDIYKCETCDLTVEKEIANTKTKHSLQKVDAVKATATTTGNIEYYCCENCKAMFKDSNAQTAVTLKEVTIPATGKELLPGDVDGDGKVSAADARLALRASVGLENYPDGSDKFILADVDEDGKISAADARLILRASVGLETLKYKKK